MTGKLVTVAQFENEPQAALCKILLEREGIESFLSEENAIAAHWGLSNALGGVKVQVKEEDTGKALEILKAAHGELGAQEGTALGEVSLVCEKCRETMTFPGKARGSVQNCPACQDYVDVPE